MFNQGNSVLVGDMFGSLSDNPLLRMAREEQYNRANAEEELKRRAEADRESKFADAFRTRANQGLWGAPGESEIAAPNIEAMQEEVFGKWGVLSPDERELGGGRRYERLPSSRVQDFREYDSLLLAAEQEPNPARKAQILEQAALMKAALDKTGKFSPKIPMLTTTDSVRTERNPLYFGGTNTPSSLSFTNTSSRLTAPASPFDVGLRMGLGSTNTPAASRPAAASKSGLANQLAAEHPDWTREQIISEVNRSFR